MNENEFRSQNPREGTLEPAQTPFPVPEGVPTGLEPESAVPVPGAEEEQPWCNAPGCLPCAAKREAEAKRVVAASGREPQWWHDLRIDPMPHSHPTGLVLNTAMACCPQCDRFDTPEIITRHITDHAQCIDCHSHLVCPECAIRFSHRFRLYPDHISIRTNDSWITVETQREGWFRRALRWLMGG